MNGSCACVTLGLVANVVAACIELDSTKGNTMSMWDYTMILWICIIETAELDREWVSCGRQNGLIFCRDCYEPRCD